MNWLNRGLGLAALFALSGIMFGVSLVGEPTSAVAQVKPEPPVKPSSDLTADLALIPGNAGGFVHVEVAKVWKNDAMKEIRKLAEKAGPKALKALDAEYKPAPSTLERVTMVMLPEKGPRIDVKIVTILAFSEPFVADDVRKLYMPKAEPKKAGGKTYYADEIQGVSLHFADDRTIAFGDAETLPAFLKIAGHPTGPLRDALAANRGKPMIACVNLKEIAAVSELEGHLPPDLKPLLKAERITVSFEMDKRVTLHAAIAFGSDDEAKAGDVALRKTADLARVELNRPRMEFERALFGEKRKDGQKLEELMKAVIAFGGLAALNTVDEILGELPLKRDGAAIAAKFELPEWATQYAAAALLSGGIALPGLQKVRNAAAVQQSQNNLKQIALAMHNYHDVHGSFPPAAICDKNGKKLLSWRVAILPYIEQDNLYKQFKLDEPWDSEHNQPFSKILVKTYMDPRSQDPKGGTHYKLFVGKETPFDWLQSKKLQDITDGTSNTVMVIAAGDAVPWAKPDDFEFDSTKPLPDLSKPFPQVIMAMCDGSVRSINPMMKDFERVMKILIGANDGMVTPDF
jgi:hypothetical protein